MFAKAVAFAAAFVLMLAAGSTVAAGGACLAPAGQPNQSNTTAVAIKNCAFGPAIAHVPVGATVTWTNDDFLPHAVAGAGWTANLTPSGQADPFGMFNPGGTISHTFKESGIFTYMCHLHPGMTGVVVVGDVAYPGAAPSQAVAPAPANAPAPVQAPLALALVIGAVIGAAGMAIVDRRYRLSDGTLAVRRGHGVHAG